MSTDSHFANMQKTEGASLVWVNNIQPTANLLQLYGNLGLCDCAVVWFK